MLNKMINALEGAKLKLEEHDSEIGGIYADLIDVMNRLDLITVNYSEVVFTENAIDKVMYGVMKISDDYYDFEGENNNLLRYLKDENFSPKDIKKIMNIYDDFFMCREYREIKEPNFLSWDYNLEELLEDIDNTINTLKEIDIHTNDNDITSEQFFKKYTGRICTINELQDAMNKVTKDGVENDFEGLYGDIGVDFKEQLTECTYLDYTISDNELGTLTFELMHLDEDDLSNSKIRVISF